MAKTQEEKLAEIKALTNELDQSVRMLKRLLAEDQEQEDRSKEGNPESLFDEL